jgi:hypothetical protein
MKKTNDVRKDEQGVSKVSSKDTRKKGNDVPRKDERKDTAKVNKDGAGSGQKKDQRKESLKKDVVSIPGREKYREEDEDKEGYLNWGPQILIKTGGVNLRECKHKLAHHIAENYHGHIEREAICVFFNEAHNKARLIDLDGNQVRISDWQKFSKSIEPIPPEGEELNPKHVACTVKCYYVDNNWGLKPIYTGIENTRADKTEK